MELIQTYGLPAGILIACALWLGRHLPEMGKTLYEDWKAQKKATAEELKAAAALAEADRVRREERFQTIITNNTQTMAEVSAAVRSLNGLVLAISQDLSFLYRRLDIDQPSRFRYLDGGEKEKE